MRCYAVFKWRSNKPPLSNRRGCLGLRNDAGLVENVPSSGGSVQVLDGHCTIKSCDFEFVVPANLA